MQQEQTKTVHHGRNVKRIREILGIKQEALASDLSLSQQAVSQLEQREALDREMIEKVAAALKVSPEAISNFNEEAAITIVSNTFNDEASAYSMNYKCSFNPIDKVVELYEALLKSEREKIDLLERMLSERK